jgi:hypothetical protein
MSIKGPSWLLLIAQLPGRVPTLRVQIWRALKASGAEQLRDGAYLLPNSAEARDIFAAQRIKIESAGGLVYTVAFDAESSEQQNTFTQLFDRSSEYDEANKRLGELKRTFAKIRESEARQGLAAARREVASIVARDFFAGKPRQQVEAALADAEAAFNAKFVPDEPSASNKAIPRLDRVDYQGRTWATRERLWIDRVASAWLIRRFIDPTARFVWLKHVKDRPKRALGFDFNGAEFTHVGSKVTFEVLLASFALENDAGLARLGALVHYLDVGGIPVPEGAGFTTIMTGARLQGLGDDALLELIAPVLDSLYAAFSNGTPKT